MEEIVITKAAPEDARQLLEYLRRIGAESDNLTFGAEGLPLSEEAEAAYLLEKSRSPRDIQLVAKRGGQIVGDASLACLSRRLAHRAELGIAVVQAEWGQGIGSRLMQALIDHARQCGVEIISLEVRSDNTRAIRLYEKFGFRRIGVFPGFLKVEGQLVDFDLMNLYLSCPT